MTNEIDRFVQETETRAALLIPQLKLEKEECFNRIRDLLSKFELTQEKMDEILQLITRHSQLTREFTMLEMIK